MLAGCASGRGLSPAEQAELEQARARFDRQEYHEALAHTDVVLRTAPNAPEARLLAGQGNLALFGITKGTAQQAFLEDAIANLEAATVAAPADPRAWLSLAEAYLQSGRFAEGRDAAREAEQLSAAAGDRKGAIAAVLKASDNEMQIFVEARRQELAEDPEAPPSSDTAQLAAAVMSRLALAQAAEPVKATIRVAQVHQWLGDVGQALLTLERGMFARPEAHELHEVYQRMLWGMERHVECVAAYERMVKAQPKTPALLLYLGRAQVCLGNLHRGQRRWSDAVVAYDKAAETFGLMKAVDPANRALADDWLGRCHLNLGRSHLEAGDLAAARQHYFAAFEVEPRVAEYEWGDGPDGERTRRPVVCDDFGGNYLGGLTMLNEALVQPSTPQALRAGFQLCADAIARHPGRFGVLYNNAALNARDLGVALAEQGKQDEARALWEQSYEWYCQAVELEPDDPRIVNDCGLMLVYHLHRDPDRAREMFERAIAKGQPRLDALPKDRANEDAATAAAREFLEEAVGDAWQNIAVLLRQQGRPFAEYREFCEKAVQYWPYQRREAAALLRANGQLADDGVTRTRARTTLEGTSALAAAAAPVADQAFAQQPGTPTAHQGQQQGAGDGKQGAGDKNAAFAVVAKEAAAKADSGDLDGALVVLDAAAKTFTGHAPYHALVGSYSLQLAEVARTENRNAAVIEGLYADATRHLERAVELDGDPVAPRLQLAKAQQATGAADKAAKTAAALLAHVRSLGGADEATVREAHRIRAVAAAGDYVAKKQKQQDDAEAAKAARESFRTLEQQGALDAKLLDTWVAMEQWSDAPGGAVEILGRALQRSPDSTELLQRLVDTGAATGQSQKVVDVLGSRQDALGLWFQGRARYDLALQLWGQQKNDPAITALDDARKAFAASATKNADYRDSSEQWDALAQGLQGLVLANSGKLDAAAKALLEAAGRRPDRIEAPLAGELSIKTGIQGVGNKLAQAGRLGEAEQLLRRALEVAPQDADLLNNHGLFARDHGNALERQGKKDAAKEMYEASYRSYTKASELSPDDVRLLNDRALMVLYHVQRDVASAKEWLDKAVTIGEARLRDAPPADEAERRNLEEAIGDAWQNLGKYYREHGNDVAAARRAYEKSIGYWSPSNRGEARRALRELDRAGSAPAPTAGTEAGKEPGK